MWLASGGGHSVLRIAGIVMALWHVVRYRSEAAAATFCLGANTAAVAAN
jgi:hypothetical protein